MSDNEPSAEAMRAGERLRIYLIVTVCAACAKNIHTPNEIARIIDRETKLPSLLARIKELEYSFSEAPNIIKKMAKLEAENKANRPPSLK